MVTFITLYYLENLNMLAPDLKARLISFPKMYNTLGLSLVNKKVRTKNWYPTICKHMSQFGLKSHGGLEVKLTDSWGVINNLVWGWDSTNGHCCITQIK